MANEVMGAEQTKQTGVRGKVCQSRHLLVVAVEPKEALQHED